MVSIGPFFIMKTPWLVLCAALFLTAIPCRAQGTDEGKTAPLLLIFAAAEEDNILPRITLGAEKPVLTIDAFEKCVRMPSFNGQQGGIAARLKPDDTKALAAAIRTLGGADPTNAHVVNVWFASPDDKVLGYLNTRYGGTNLLSGVLSFYDGDAREIVAYLTEKLHPK